MMDFTEVKDRLKQHHWRMRFAFLPVRRVVLDKEYVVDGGWYWWRIVVEVKVGLLQEWTAYAHYNDNVKFEGG